MSLTLEEQTKLENILCPLTVTDSNYVLDIIDRLQKAQACLNATEALFSFVGWLTTRHEPVTFSANCDATVAVDLIADFIKVNNLPECRDDFALRIVPMPPSLAEQHPFADAWSAPGMEVYDQAEQGNQSV
jgi:hypothetical protein